MSQSVDLARAKEEVRTILKLSRLPETRHTSRGLCIINIRPGKYQVPKIPKCWSARLCRCNTYQQSKLVLPNPEASSTYQNLFISEMLSTNGFKCWSDCTSLI